ncbi:hypothetical protein FOA52_007371 [Chlamydomonas sp. UWO 241]|nr:hypothetical protein FOA52_007371 [Chlamydomonas sp. UWO 241]
MVAPQDVIRVPVVALGGCGTKHAPHAVHGACAPGGSGTSSASTSISAGAQFLPLLHSRWLDDAPWSPGIGLANLGNSCYLNSVLQCLACLPPMSNVLSADTRALHGLHACPLPQRNLPCTACVLSGVLRQLLPGKGRGGGGGAPVRPSQLVGNLGLVSKVFVRGRQEDAHEFLSCLIDAVERDCRRGLVVLGAPKAPPAHTLVQEVFTGRTVSQVRCLSCGHCSNTTEAFTALSLDLGGAIDSVGASLAAFTAPEHLEGANQYKCDKCACLVRARKQVAIYDEPNVLVLHLKRFASSIFGGSGKKIGRHVSYEPKLSLQRFSAESLLRMPALGEGGGAAAAQQAQPQHPPAGYHLHSVLVHQGGSLGSGHYYAAVRDSGGGWHVANDEDVGRVSADYALGLQAYLLFYVRSRMKATQAPPPAPPPAAGAGAPPVHAARAARPPTLPSTPAQAKPVPTAVAAASALTQRAGCARAPIGPQLPPGKRPREDSEASGSGGDGGGGGGSGRDGGTGWVDVGETAGQRAVSTSEPAHQLQGGGQQQQARQGRQQQQQQPGVTRLPGTSASGRPVVSLPPKPAAATAAASPAAAAAAAAASASGRPVVSLPPKPAAAATTAASPAAATMTAAAAAAATTSRSDNAEPHRHRHAGGHHHTHASSNGGAGHHHPHASNGDTHTHKHTHDHDRDRGHGDNGTNDTSGNNDTNGVNGHARHHSDAPRGDRGSAAAEGGEAGAHAQKRVHEHDARRSSDGDGASKRARVVGGVSDPAGEWRRGISDREKEELRRNSAYRSDLHGAIAAFVERELAGAADAADAAAAAGGGAAGRTQAAALDEVEAQLAGSGSAVNELRVQLRRLVPRHAPDVIGRARDAVVAMLQEGGD